jgi:AcrR family transcriptional regulator
MDSKSSRPRKSQTKRAGRPRDDESQEAILRAALDLVKESGYRALTIERIAGRAGAGKTTIYRWWPSKAAVVMEAFLKYISPEIEFPSVSTVSPSESIRQQMQSVARAYRGPHGDLLRALIAEAQFDRELASAFVTNWIRPRREMATAILQSGIASGELESDIDVNVAIDALYGALYYRFLIPYAPLSQKFAREVANTVLNGLAVTRSKKRG